MPRNPLTNLDNLRIPGRQENSSRSVHVPYDLVNHIDEFLKNE